MESWSTHGASLSRPSVIVGVVVAMLFAMRTTFSTIFIMHAAPPAALARPPARPISGGRNQQSSAPLSILSGILSGVGSH